MLVYLITVRQKWSANAEDGKSGPGMYTIVCKLHVLQDFVHYKDAGMKWPLYLVLFHLQTQNNYNLKNYNLRLSGLLGLKFQHHKHQSILSFLPMDIKKSTQNPLPQ